MPQPDSLIMILESSIRVMQQIVVSLMIVIYDHTMFIEYFFLHYKQQKQH